MIMTQIEMTKFLDQINQAFKDQFDKLDLLENRVKELEEKVDAKEERPKTRTSGSKRV